MTHVGFIGLGTMGSGICNNIIEKGNIVTCFDIKRDNLKKFEGKAKLAESPTEVLLSSDVTFLSLPGSIEVEEITKEFLSSGVAGRTVIDLSTSFPFSTQKIYKRFKENGGFFADASLSGTPKQAAEGKLIVLFGGDKEVYEKYLSLMQTFGRQVYYMGSSGSGNLAKLINNYLAIMYDLLYAEIFPFAEKMGIDVNKLFDIIGNSGVNCPMYQNAGAKIVRQTYEPAFALNLALKDLTYVKRLFEEMGVPSFLLDGGLNIMRIAKSQSLGDRDITESARVSRRFLGLE